MTATHTAPAAHHAPPPRGLAEAAQALPFSTPLVPSGQEHAVGLRIAQARKTANLSRPQLAKKLGLKTKDITRIEIGAEAITLDLAREIAAALAVDTTWLWLGLPLHTKPVGLIKIADELERLHAEIGCIESNLEGNVEGGRGLSVLNAWWTTAQAVPSMPITSNDDLVALARICRVTWDRTRGDLCDLRDTLDQKLAAAMTYDATPANLSRDNAELISECAAFDALERRRNALLYDGDDKPADEVARDEAISDQIYETQEKHFDRIMALRATTLAGLQAKVQTLTLENLEILKSGSGDRSDCLVTSICRDVLGDISDRDAPVLLACAEARRLRAETDAFPGDMDEAFEEICGRQSEAVRAVGAVKATSFAGLRAQAKLILEEQAACRHEGFNHSVAENAALLLLEQLAGDADPVEHGGLPALISDAQHLHAEVKRLTGSDDETYAAAVDRLDASLDVLGKALFGRDAPDLSAHIPTADDGDYIALCDRLVEAWREYDRVSSYMDALPVEQQDAFDRESLDPAYVKAEAIFDEILAAPIPTTAAGMRAAARAAIVETSENKAGEPVVIETDHIGETLAWKLIKQIAGASNPAVL